MKNIIVDCGSNIGWIVDHYIKMYPYTEWDYICIEPNPYCVQVLKEKFKSNENIKILQNAVSSIKKTCSFRFSSRLSEGGTINSNKIESASETVVIETITLPEISDLCSSYDKKIIKIDIEGEEYDLMDYMISNNLHLQFSKIICEFHSDYMNDLNYYNRQNKIVNFFKEKDYLVKEISKNQFLIEDNSMLSIQDIIIAH